MGLHVKSVFLRIVDQLGPGNMLQHYKAEGVMEIVLQHERNGLFLGEERGWVETSQEARKFATGNEAVRFANAAHFALQVRIVARYERNQHAILLPLVGSLANY